MHVGALAKVVEFHKKEFFNKGPSHNTGTGPTRLAAPLPLASEHALRHVWSPHAKQIAPCVAVRACHSLRVS